MKCPECGCRMILMDENCNADSCYVCEQCGFVDGDDY